MDMYIGLSLYVPDLVFGIGGTEQKAKPHSF